MKITNILNMKPYFNLKLVSAVIILLMTSSCTNSAKQEKEIQLFARGYDSKTQLIEYQPEDSLNDIKLKIQDKIGIKPESQLLYYNGKIVNHKDNLEPGVTIDVSSPIKGGTPFRWTKFGKNNESVKNMKEKKFSSSAPSWRIVYPGLNLEGRCNNPKCEAYGKKVWCIFKQKDSDINLTSRMGGTITETDKGEKVMVTVLPIGDYRSYCRCPNCDTLVPDDSVVNMGFYDCYFDIKGKTHEGKVIVENYGNKINSNEGFMYFNSKVLGKELFDFVSVVTRPINYKQIKEDKKRERISQRSREEERERQLAESRRREEQEKEARIEAERRARITEEKVQEIEERRMQEEKARIEAEEKARITEQKAQERIEKDRKLNELIFKEIIMGLSSLNIGPEKIAQIKEKYLGKSSYNVDDCQKYACDMSPVTLPSSQALSPSVSPPGAKSIKASFVDISDQEILHSTSLQKSDIESTQDNNPSTEEGVKEIEEKSYYDSDDDSESNSSNIFGKLLVQYFTQAPNENSVTEGVMDNEISIQASRSLCLSPSPSQGYIKVTSTKE